MINPEDIPEEVVHAFKATWRQENFNIGRGIGKEGQRTRAGLAAALNKLYEIDLAAATGDYKGEPPYSGAFEAMDFGAINKEIRERTAAEQAVVDEGSEVAYYTKQVEDSMMVYWLTGHYKDGPLTQEIIDKVREDVREDFEHKRMLRSQKLDPTQKRHPIKTNVPPLPEKLDGPIG